MPDIFISYSRRDLQFGKQLHQGFTGLGKDVWMDWEDIPLSSDWWSEIKRGIDTSDNFVLIMSPDSIGSPVCHLEIEHARNMHKRIVPIMHRDPQKDTAFAGVKERIEADEYLKKMMGEHDAAKLCEENWDVLGSLNWVFFKPEDVFDDKFRQLTQVLEADLTHVRQHTRLQTRALEWKNSHNNVSFVVSGDELHAAEDWLTVSAAKQPAPTELHKEYVLASRRVENNRRRLVRILTGASVGLGVMIVLALSGALFAITRANAAQEKADAASTQVMVAETEQEVAMETASFSATQAAVAAATLTAVPPTMTAVAIEVETGERHAAVLRLAGEASEIMERDNGNPEIAALLSIRALKSEYSASADNSLTLSVDDLSTRMLIAPHSDSMTTAAYSPDEQTIATGGYDAQVHLWDAATGKALQSFDAGGSVNHLVYSPDGKMMVVALYDHFAVLMDAATGKILHKLDGHTDIVWWSAVSSDGKLVATASADKTARLWNAADGKLLHTMQVGTIVYSVSFSPDGTVLATGSDDGIVRLWDTETGELITALETEIPLGMIYNVTFDPEGDYLAASYADTSVRLWDMNTGEVAEILEGHIGYVDAMAFSSDGLTLATAGDDFTVRLWDVEPQDDPEEANPEAVFILRGHTDRVYDVRFSSDAMLLTASLDGTARVWDILQTISPKVYQVSQLVTDVDFSSDGKLTAAASSDTNAYIRDAVTGEVLHVLEPHDDWVESVEFSPDSTQVVTASDDKFVRLWDTKTGKLLKTFAGHTAFVYNAHFSADGKRLISASEDGTARIWDIATGDALVLDNHSVSVQDAIFSPDGKMVASASSDNNVWLWDATTGEQLTPLVGHTDFVNRLAFSPDGKLLASASHDFSIRLWDMDTGEAVQTLTGHNFWALDVAFSRDGKLLVSASADGTARIWDVASGQTLRVLAGHKERMSSVAFSPDGKQVLTGDFAGMVRLWDVDYRDFVTYACTRLLRDLSEAERRIYGVDDTPTCPA